MGKTLLAAGLLALAVPALGQTQMEPGQWEFTTTITSPLMPQPQVATYTQCVTLDQSRDPERWMGQKPQGDCTVTPGERTRNSFSMTMSCPKTGMQGSIVLRYTAESIESDMHMRGEMQGRKFEMRNRMSGKRVGPCQS